MKQGSFILSASIAAALAGAPALAQSVATGSTAEAPRVTQTVDSNVVSTVQNTHLRFANKKAASGVLADTTPMNHLQLVLKRSAARQAALDSLIADQHNPKAARFHQWLTPQQFGEEYGVTDADIAAAKSWLVAQGFTVNGVYPNKMQIDFSGSAGQVSHAFHTQENRYTMKDGSQHVANAGDISIPTALSAVVTGVAGLNDFHPQALHKSSKLAQWNASKKTFDIKATTKTGPKGMAIVFGSQPNQSGVTRGLVPNDLATMYGIKTIRANGVTGKGVTIAVVDDNDMVPSDWTNFVSTFNLGQYGGTFSQINPVTPAGITNNCVDPIVANPEGSANYDPDDGETLLDAEWSTAIAPGANIVVATCADGGNSNFFGGVFAAATNLINGSTRPDIISASYGFGEFFVDSASKSAIDLMWAQADAEGISVFVSTGDSGSNPSFNGSVINGYYGNTAVDANAFATSPNDTGVGGTDIADVLDGTTNQYFASTPSVVGGSALSYVPEIPWNTSCGNGVAATRYYYPNALAYCIAAIEGYVKNGPTITSEAGSGGPSSVDRKPAWQRQVFNAAKDQSRDLPDVALFAGSYGNNTFVMTCTNAYPCAPGFTGEYQLSSGTSLSSPMFAGIQALIDQGLHARGLPIDQGNAAPTLYALAANEYGAATGTAPASLAACNANNGTNGTANCVFHNVTRGTIATNCIEVDGGSNATSNCYFYDGFGYDYGLTTVAANPTTYTAAVSAFPAQAGWSFASGLGSVNATNLLIAWRAFVNAPPAP